MINKFDSDLTYVLSIMFIRKLFEKDYYGLKIGRTISIIPQDSLLMWESVQN